MQLTVPYVDIKRGQTPTVIAEGYDFYLVRHRGKRIYVPKCFFGYVDMKKEEDDDEETW